MNRYLFLVTCLYVSFGRVSAQEDSSRFQRKSKTTAMLLAVSCTVLPALVGIQNANSSTSDGPQAMWATVGAAGVIVGPAAGKLYAHDYNSYGGMLMRAAACGILAYGLGSVKISIGGSSDEDDSGAFFIYPGVILLAGSIYHTIATTPKAVDTYNTNRGFSVMPTYDAKRKTARINLTMSF